MFEVAIAIIVFLALLFIGVPVSFAVIGGSTGAGKSTLVAALTRRGLPMFCDDTLVMDLSEHLIVLDYGEVIADGDPGSVARHPAVLTAYLGTETVDSDA